MIVVDASALVEVLRRTSKADAIEARFHRAGGSLHAPHLVDVEVTHVLRRYAMHGDLDAARGRAALADLSDMPIRRYPHTWLTPTAWRLRANISAYDAMYVALADALSAPLLTCDRRLAAAAGSSVEIQLV